MKKLLKIMGRLFLGIILILAAALLIMFIANRILLRKEESLLKSYPGDLSDVTFTEFDCSHNDITDTETEQMITDIKGYISRLGG